MKRKILSMVLTLCLLLSMFPALVPGASAEEPEEEYIVEEPAELEPEEEIDAIAEDPVVEPLDGDGSTVLASGYCGGEGDGTNLTWTLTDDGTLTISGEGEMANYGYTSELENKTTAPWGEYEPSYLTTLVIENGITTIGSCAFYNCSSLTGELMIPDSVTSIEYGAFLYCAGLYGKLLIPSAVEYIGEKAFSGCMEITEINVEPSNPQYASMNGIVYSKDYRALILAPGGIVGELVILDSVEYIENGAFFDCRGLTGNLVIPDSVMYIGDEAFSGCSGFTGNLVIPDGAYMGDGAFVGCSGFTELSLPDSMTNVKNCCFKNCSGFVGNLVIPDSVTDIGYEAFYGCYGFTGLSLSDGLTNIGDSAFENCSGFTGNLLIPDSVTSIGWHAFSECNGFTGELLIPDSVTRIDYWAFSDCSGFTGELFIPASVTAIGIGFINGCKGISNIEVDRENSKYASSNGVLYDKEFTEAIRAPEGILGELVIPDSVIVIDAFAFWRCDGLAGKLNLPDGIIKFENYAFSGCSGFDGSLILPEKVTNINYRAFEGCTGFVGKLVIPNSVTEIESNAFSGCSGLSGDVYFEGDAPSVTNSSTYWSSFPSNFTLYYIPGTTGWTDSDAYDADAGTWNGYKLDTWDGTGESNVIASGYCGGEGDGTNLTWTLTDDGTLTISGTGAMANYGYSSSDGTTAPWVEYKSSVMTLIIEEDVMSIGEFAFGDCTSLTKITIPSSVVDIGSSAFRDCTGLTEITIPDGVVYIGTHAFYGCSGLIHITIPSSATSISEGAFANCSRLTTAGPIGGAFAIEFGWTDTIPSNTFSDCYSLTQVTIPYGITSIGHYAFGTCSGLSEITIPSSVTSISYGAFCCCYGLTQVTIPSSVTSIGEIAFANCSGLTGVYFEGNAPTVTATSAYGSSFPTNVTLYYIPGTTGWTDSDAYDAEAGTWNGYKLDTWDGTGESNVIASGYCGGEGDGTNLTWTLTDDGTLTISGEGKMKDYSYEYGYDNNDRWLRKSQAPWMEFEESFGTLVIENGVTSIGDYAFYDCSGFVGKLTIPDSVTSIGSDAFYDCSGFTGDLVIPDGVTSIGSNAFSYCSGITGDLEIPDSVTEIGDYFVDGCSGISRIEVSSLNTAYASKDGVLYDVEFSKAIRAPEGISGNLVIPDGVTEIASCAFYNCSGFTGDLVIPDGVTYIGQCAFYGCSGFNGNLVIPNSVTFINDWAFQNCSGLTGNLVIPDSVAFAGEIGTFCGCSGFTGDLVIPEGMYWIACEMFQGCTGLSGNVYFKGNAPGVSGASEDDSSFPSDFTLYYIPGTTGWTDSDAYDADAGTWNGYKLDTWDGTGESNVIASGYCGGEGDGTNLTWTLTDDGTLTISGTGAMADFGYEYDYENNEWIFTVPWTSYVDSLKTLVIESGVTTIGNNAFKDCSGFTGDLVIPDGVTTIGDSAFSNCSGFTGELNIPDTVTSIGAWAFSECRGFTGKLSLHSGVTNIGEAAFQMCEGLTGELVIPDSLTSIKDFVFSWCGFTGELVIPSSVTSIGECAFQNCSGFTGELVIPSSVTSIGDSAFHSCSGFTGTLVIPSTVTEIESSPFSGTSGITWIEVESANPNYASKDGILYDKDFSIVIQAPGGLSGELNIPDSVTTIGKSAFYFCKNLTGDLVIPNGVTSIGDGAFNNCSSFTGSLVIPAGVTRIESLAFAYCSGFSGDLVIPSGVSSIGILAFDGCTGLSGDVYFEGNAPTVTAASEVFHSFPVDFTLYYTPGTTGWTDSEYYDADAGTWNGYKLEVWDTSEIDEDTPRLVVQPVTGRPGDTVEVKINVENNPGLVGIATMVTFDSDILEYVSCEISSEFGGVNNSHLNGNTLKTIWVTGDEAVTVNDTFLTITFKINEDAEDGDTYITLDYDYDNTLDANEECIEFATFGDYVTVFSGILGDVNNSGTVTSLDVRWILQYLSGAREFSEDQLALADVNSSGTVTSLDVRWILQYLSGARDENYQAK